MDGSSGPRPTGSAGAPPAPAPGGLLRGYAALVCVQLCFGLFPVFAKLAMEGFGPRAVAVWRFAVGSATLLAVAFLRHGRRAIPRRGDLPRLALCGLLGVAVNMVVFLEGLERTTAVDAGLLMPMIPVYTLVIAVAARQERFDARRASGLVLALGGALLLLSQRGPDFSREHLAGNLLIVLNTFSYSVYLVVSKPLLGRYPPLVLIAWVFALSLWTVPCFWRGDPPLVPPDAAAGSWLSLGYVLMFATIASYVLNAVALSVVSASTTATFILLQPLIAATGGVVILGERFLPGTWLAATAILAGVWLVVRAPARRAPASAGATP